MRFRVYTPQMPTRWTPFVSPAWRAPWVFLLWLVRGIRFRLRRPSLGRGVTLEDMLRVHPGKPKRCLCYGHGLIWTYRDGERGAQFCAAMVQAFQDRARGRVVGMRWLAGYEPEALVAPAPTDDRKPRARGCKCHQEEGDSPCPVHGEEAAPPESVCGRP